MIRSLLFDMDGTIYPLQGGFSQSPAYQEIKKRMVDFIRERNRIDDAKAKKILIGIKERYGRNVSVGIETEFGIPREEYFSSVWDIDPAAYIPKDPALRKNLELLSERFEIAILSDAPRCWINKVLEFLQIEDLFEGRIFDGQGERNKSAGSAFPWAAERLGKPPQEILMIGDEDEIDIIPAKKAGMKTAKIGAPTDADYCAESVAALAQLLLGKKRRLQIGVMGSAADLAYSKEIEWIAERVGELIAKSGNIVVYGAEKDYDSLSTAAARGAKKADGTTVGVTYGTGKDIWDTQNTDVIIVSGLARGGGREFTLINSCDSVIAISGGSGTLTELAMAYQLDIPMIVIEGSGGWADKLANTFFDGRKRRRVIGAMTPEEAVETAIRESTSRIVAKEANVIPK